MNQGPSSCAGRWLPWPQETPLRMGAHVLAGGVGFAVAAPDAWAVELCLFDADAAAPQGEQRLPMHTGHGAAAGVFHGFLAGAGAGLRYGLRAHGPWAPAQQQRFNPHKLLLDPYARAIVEPPGGWRSRPEHHAYVLGGPTDRFDARDNAPWALTARVLPPWPPLRQPRPRVAAHRRVILEVQVSAFSRLHPEIPPALRGTYGALAHPAAIAHFRRLGVTTLELLPVHHHLDEPHLQGLGLRNHWGYNTIGFFAADPRFAQQPEHSAAEFRAMVEALHAAGLEVVLDVVYNHTPEGNLQGPSLSWRGLGQRQWYRQEDFTHCGNTLQLAHPRVLQWALDSLRYWHQEMGVDGFRFDLAPVLLRDRQGHFDAQGAFEAALSQCPQLQTALRIAEPWDGGPQGYRMADFPPPWLAWNDRFRDAARSFWLGRGDAAGALADALAGSPAAFRHQGPQAALASVNFITCHDGFTLADLVSYDRKHNHANGEDNRDGRGDELSASFGTEGPTDDPARQATRHAVQRALLATLLLAAGTPMLLAGDELGHSQQGNNNAYAQDNALTWLDWAGADRRLLELTAALLDLRQRLPALTPATRAQAPVADWHGEAGLLWGVLTPLAPPDSPRLLLVAHARGAPAGWAAPPAAPGCRWACRLDTRQTLADGEPPPTGLPARALLLFEEVREAASAADEAASVKAAEPPARAAPAAQAPAAAATADWRGASAADPTLRPVLTRPGPAR